MADAVCIAAGSSLLASSLLSEEIDSKIVDGKLDDEGQVIALITLVAKCGIETAAAITKRQYQRFDSNPGEAACQSRAAILLHFSTLDLSRGSKELESVCKGVQKALVMRNNDQAKGKDTPPIVEFYQRMVGKVRVSRIMDFFLHARMLTVLRTRRSTTADGIVITNTSTCQFPKLSKRINCVDRFDLSTIAESSQVKHTMQCIDEMHRLAIDPLAKRMTEPENVVQFSANPDYKPKHFSCHYFEVVTLMDLIERESAVIALKIFREGAKPEAIFFHDGKRVDSPEKEVKVVVIDAVGKASNDDIIEEIEEVGLRAGILAQASLLPPFHGKSTLVDIKCDEAREEVKRAREERPLVTIEVDHIYLNIAKYEVVKK